jgi:NAD(P)H-quinone oxidoreductase subunit I
MAGLPLVPELLKQLFRRPATNAFPSRYLPSSVTVFLAKVSRGETTINPPVPIPPRYRGKIVYDRESCIGCQLCLKVCPAHAIEFLPDTKRVRIYITQCIFCSQCNDICPADSLHMSPEFLLATENRYAESQIVE